MIHKWKKFITLSLLLTACLFFAASTLTAGENLLVNAGFEQLDENGEFAADWHMNPAYKGKLTLIENAAESYRGSRCVKMQQSEKLFVAMFQGRRVNLAAKRNVTASVWAKGKGTVTMLFYRYSTYAAVASTASEKLIVNHDEWKKYTVSVAIPEKVSVGKFVNEPVVRFCLAMHVEGGPVFVDDVELYWKGEEPKEEADEKQIRPSGPPLPHRITIPQTTAAPRIDGVIEPDEWARAAAVTGFLELGGRLAERQTLVYATYDEEKLYFAFESTSEGILREGVTGRDFRTGDPHDAIEVWLEPPGKGWYQFYGVPKGGFLDLSKGGGFGWNGNWEYSCKVADSGAAAGGILTFAKKIWSAEISIPFRDLDVSGPKAGEVWRMNFCRDWSVEKSQDRRSQDWTTWSFIRGNFATPGMFSYVRFGGPDSPALQITALGYLPSGNLSVKGKVLGKKGDKVDIRAELVIEGKRPKVVLEKHQSIDLPATGSDDVSFADTIKLTGKTNMRLVLSSRNMLTDTDLSRLEIPFTAVSSFSVKPIPIYTKGFMDVEVDASRLPDLPKEARLLIEIPGTGISRTVEMKEDAPKITERFDISGLSPGDYLLKAALFDHSGNQFALSGEPLPVPEKPEWLDNTIGISDEVPAPWKPIEVDGNSISVTDREYHLSASGLPARITSLEKDILSAPAALSAVVDGKEVSWEFEPLVQTSRKDGEVSWDVSGFGGPLNLTGSLKMEFDGFALLRFKIESAKKVKINSLSLEFPLHKDFALYARGRRYLPPELFCFASLYENTFASAKEMDMGDRGRWIYSPVWKWDQVLFTEIWVGDDRRGFALMCETDQYIKGEKYAEFVREGDSVTLRVHLISESTAPASPLVYEYAYQAAPVKPQPQDPKMWQPSCLATDKFPEFIKRSSVAVNYHILSDTNYPKFRNPASGKAIIKKMAEYGLKVMPDTHLSIAAMETPEYKLYGYEWEVIPRSGWVATTGRAAYVCHSTSHPQFYLHSVKVMVEELGLGGVYIDVSDPFANESPYSNCGYVDEKGNRRPTVPLWAAREFYKRLYTYLHAEGRGGTIFSHTMRDTCLAGFQDVVTQGEEWCVEGVNQYKRLSPDMFRAKAMKNQYGTPFTFYIFHQYSWRAKAYGEPVSLDETLMMCLPHRILPTIMDDVGMREIPPIWDLFGPWWTSSEFIGYWDARCPVRTGSEEVLASIYLKADEKKALVIVSNWKYDKATAEVTIDWSKLGWQPDAVSIKDARSGKPVAFEKDKVTFPLAARRLRILELNQK